MQHKHIDIATVLASSGHSEKVRTAIQATYFEQVRDERRSTAKSLTRSKKVVVLFDTDLSNADQGSILANLCGKSVAGNPVELLELQQSVRKAMLALPVEDRVVLAVDLAAKQNLSDTEAISLAQCPPAEYERIVRAATSSKHSLRGKVYRAKRKAAEALSHIVTLSLGLVLAILSSAAPSHATATAGCLLAKSDVAGSKVTATIEWIDLSQLTINESKVT